MAKIEAGCKLADFSFNTPFESDVKLSEKAKGAKKIYACATHGLFSGPAYERLENSCIEEVVVTNAVPVPLERQTGKIKVVTLDPLFAQTIKNVYNNGSVASLFE